MQARFLQATFIVNQWSHFHSLEVYNDALLITFMQQKLLPRQRNHTTKLSSRKVPTNNWTFLKLNPSKQIYKFKFVDCDSQVTHRKVSFLSKTISVIFLCKRFLSAV